MVHSQVKLSYSYETEFSKNNDLESVHNKIIKRKKAAY